MEPIRILSTRPLEAALFEQAAGKGILIDTLPFIVTEPVVEVGLQNRLLDLSRQPLAAVFTSMNAVEAVAQQLGLTEGHDAGPEAATARTAADWPSGNPLPASREKRSTAPRPRWTIYCIGYATQQLVRQYFGEDTIAGTAASAAALAEVIVRQVRGQAMIGDANAMVGQPSVAGQASVAGQPAGDVRGEVTFFCGDQRRDELPEKLQQQGFRVNELVVYRTVRTPHKVEPVYDGIVFFSPSAVHSFFAVNTLPADTVLFAIGQTTADTIRSYTSNQTLLSESPEKETLIRQVIDYYTIKL